MPRKTTFQRKPWSEDQFNQQRSLVLGAQLDNSTWHGYKSALHSWESFTALHHYPLEPTTTTMSNFIMFMSTVIKPSSVSTYLSGIIRCLQPRYPGIVATRNSRLVKDTLAGCKRLYGTPTARKPPLSLANIRQIHATECSSYDQLLFKCLIIVGFHCLLRLGDLCDPADTHLINPAKRATRSSVRFSDDSISFLLPHSKSDKFFRGNEILVKNTWSGINITTLFSTYLRHRDNKFPYHSPLWLTSNGSVPSRSFFMKWLQSCHLPPAISGHSMRSGGATALAAAGFSSETIQAIGRWESDTWKIYIRCHPLLLSFIRPQIATELTAHRQ